MNQVLTAEYWQSFGERALDWIVSVLPSLIVLVILLIVSLRLMRFLVRSLSQILNKRIQKKDQRAIAETQKRINTLMGILRNISRIIIWGIFLMILLPKLGINIAPILAGAGIVGLAVGFGAQELVRDVISGFFILLEDQIRTGDVAIINGTGGLVEDIELRTIILRDLSGNMHVFQNGKINTLTNMTKDWSAIVFDIGVAYKEDIDQVMKLMKKVGDHLKDDAEYGNLILEPIEVFGLDQFGDSALVIRARIKTQPIEQWKVGREYRRRLKIAFDQEGIEIPFPHQTVYWGEEIKPLKIDQS